MPYIMVDSIRGSLLLEKKNKVVDAVIGCIGPMGVPIDRINVIFNEHSAEDWAIGGMFQTREKEMPVLVTACLSPERFFEKQKKEILKMLTSIFVEIGFSRERIGVFFQDMSFHKFATGGVFMWEIATEHPPLK
jgi:phenylpyruvate tautomerase PptA (4-oxalocrotonate tautomerase family)